ncbi:MAG TPA: hypothetical protein VGF30_16235 [Bacteroidia bacterium]
MKANLLQIILTLFSFSTLFFSCSENGSSQNETEAPKEDTTLIFTINGTRKAFTLKKEKFFDLRNFQEFLDHYSGKALTHFARIESDLTGDGINEEILTKLHMEDGKAILHCYILKNDEQVYADTLISDDEYFAGEYWNNDTAYYQLKPYSTFYHMLRYTDVLLEGKEQGMNENLIEFYQNMRSNELSETVKDSVKLKIKMDSITTYLKGFKGKLIQSLSLMDADVLFWNENTERFELLYMP